MGVEELRFCSQDPDHASDVPPQLKSSSGPASASGEVIPSESEDDDEGEEDELDDEEADDERKDGTGKYGIFDRCKHGEVQ